MKKGRKNNRLALLTSSLSLAIVCPLTHATDIHFDYTSFDNPNNPAVTPHFGQAQFNVLNYPSINGNYMMTSTDTHRPEMVANNNALAEFYNNFPRIGSDAAPSDYNKQMNAGGLNGVTEADTINSYTVSNSTHNGARPTYVILNELSPSLTYDTTQTGINYRQWVLDAATRLHDTYGYEVITYSPFANPASGIDSFWQALSAKSNIAVENYLSGTGVMNHGTDYASRVAWAQAQYAWSITAFGNRGVPASKLFLGEHYGNTVTGTPYGRSGLSASDWDTVIQIRQDAIRNCNYAGFLAYSWGSNGMLISEAEQIEHEYWYRTRLVMPGQQPQWLPDDTYNVNGTQVPLSWGQELNWLGGVPNASGAIANFYRTNVTGARTITLDGSRTVSTLSFNSPNSFTITPGSGGSITLSGAGANISVPQGTHTIAAPLVLGANATIDVAGTLSLTAGLSDSAAQTITRTSAGTLTVAGVQSYAAGSILNANAGTTNLNSDGGANLTVNANSTVNFGSSQRLGGLTIASGKVATLTAGGAKTLNLGTLGVTGKLNLNDNDAIIRSGTVGTFTGTTYTGLTGSIVAGRNDGGWNGTAGIVASASGSLTGLGIAAASDIGVTATALWNSQSVNSTDTLIMYTYVGDATLDGKINIDDYTRIDAGIASGTTGWSNGDFNYDGKVNIDDYTIIDNNIGMQGPPLSSAGGIAEGLVAIPEPTATVLMILPALALLPRRSRRRGHLG